MIKLTLEEGNDLIAKFMGYEYFETGVLVDYSECGGIYDSMNVYILERKTHRSSADGI